MCLQSTHLVGPPAARVLEPSLTVLHCTSQPAQRPAGEDTCFVSEPSCARPVERLSSVNCRYYRGKPDVASKWETKVTEEKQSLERSKVQNRLKLVVAIEVEWA
jgi:hypothetical protein